LNFYSFRKIKYIDTIKIDPKLEEETANYWRFKHESFRRGKPELLTEIKRMNGHKQVATVAQTVASKEVPMEIVSSNFEVEKPNQEVLTLKQKIEEMTKNIDELTLIVQKVSLKQEEHEKIVDERREPEPDLKRKKMGADLQVSPDTVVSVNYSNYGREGLFSNSSVPDEMISNIDMDMDNFPSLGEQLPLSREQSNSSEITDAEFVNQLFTTFNDDQSDDDDLPFSMDSSLLSSDPILMPAIEPVKIPTIDNRPDPELMQRLGDALMLLPRATQEMIINRLIAAITSTEGLDSAITDTINVVENKSRAAVVVEDKVPPTPEPTSETSVSTPLAAATFAALLRHFAQQQGHGKCQKNVPKSIPVIPVHA
jgi:HSF-type DNA-binding